MLFDGDGSRMTPSHAVKKGTRYRYYALDELAYIHHSPRHQSRMTAPPAVYATLTTSRRRASNRC